MSALLAVTPADRASLTRSAVNGTSTAATASRGMTSRTPSFCRMPSLESIASTSRPWADRPAAVDQLLLVEELLGVGERTHQRVGARLVAVFADQRAAGVAAVRPTDDQQPEHGQRDQDGQADRRL